MNYIEMENNVRKAKEGNNEHLQLILNHYKSYILKTAREFNIRNYDNYDLAQLGYIAILRALDKYKIGSNTFSPYAKKCITNAIRYAARNNSKYNVELSLHAPVHSGQDLGINFIDLMEAKDNPVDDILNSELRLELKRAISKLPIDEVDLINSVYYKDRPLKSYAREKDMSYLQAIRKRNGILKKLNNLMKIS